MSNLDSVIEYPEKTYKEWLQEMEKNRYASVGLGQPSEWSDEQIQTIVHNKVAIEAIR